MPPAQPTCLTYVAKLCVCPLPNTCLVEEHKRDIITVLLCRFYGPSVGTCWSSSTFCLFSFLLCCLCNAAVCVICEVQSIIYVPSPRGFNSLSCPFSRSPLSIFAAAAWMAIILAVCTRLLTATVWFRPESCIWPIWLCPFVLFVWIRLVDFVFLVIFWHNWFSLSLIFGVFSLAFLRQLHVFMFFFIWCKLPSSCVWIVILWLLFFLVFYCTRRWRCCVSFVHALLCHLGCFFFFLFVKLLCPFEWSVRFFLLSNDRSTSVEAATRASISKYGMFVAFVCKKRWDSTCTFIFDVALLVVWLFDCLVFLTTVAVVFLLVVD